MHPYRPVTVDGRGLDDIEPPARVAVPAADARATCASARRCAANPPHDPDFGVGDFPALLDKRQADTRYLRRLRSVGAATAMADGISVVTDRAPLAAAGLLRRQLHHGRRRGRRSAPRSWRVRIAAARHLRGAAAAGGAAAGGAAARAARMSSGGYCRLMLRCLGVRITVSGGPIRNLRGVLVVSGHVSWVDIFAIGAVHARLVRRQAPT